MLILLASMLAGIAALVVIVVRMNENDVRGRRKVYRAGLHE
jgi:hypothetical protein